MRDRTNIDLVAGTYTMVVIDPPAQRPPPLPSTEGAHLVAPDSAAVLLVDA
ncbi:hypothetical protein [Streptomyces sp. MMG1121]|uniref:hypothetical protein n=1 Tax=Streptomyces sp. MMG1121 TaxID=1415544 RepID=UPI00131E05B3|nr:hypothetical protein [Streptomyces sp. MMG1121]